MHAVSVCDSCMQNRNENTLGMDNNHTDLDTPYIQMGSEVLFLTCTIKIFEITISGFQYYLLNSYLPLSSDRLLKQDSV